MRFKIGLLLFPNLTQLDLTGPYEVFTKFPDTDVHLLWKTLDPVTAGGGMRLMPTTTFADSPRLDLVCVPGGAGMNALLNDEETLDFVRRQASGRATSPPFARGRWCSARRDCCRASGRRRTGCRCRCSPPSAASRWPSAWWSTAT